jgi:hypothetical protein
LRAALRKGGCVSVLSSWETISAEDYRCAFERFGGSFAVHPRVVAIVESLAKRPVRYVGLAQNAELVAGVPLWGKRIVATKLALTFYRKSHVIDVGDAEIILPVSEGVRINMPFMAHMISDLHAHNISNVELEIDSALTLTKGLRSGEHRQSSASFKKRGRAARHFLTRGGRFRPVDELSANEVAAIYTGLYAKRWGGSPQGKELLPIVLQEIKELLCGDVLYFNDRPVAIELLYRHETARWLLANNVQRGFDPEFRDYSVGSISLFHNIGKLEEEARIKDKTLRYTLGWNDAPYKARWAYATPAYRLASSNSFQWMEADLHLMQFLSDLRRNVKPCLKALFQIL